MPTVSTNSINWDFCDTTGRQFASHLIIPQIHMPSSGISTIAFPKMKSYQDPIFPLEVIELIIHETWALTLSTSERARFLKTSLLVNCHWLNAIARESCTDVHLLSSSHAIWYDGITFGKSFAYSALVGMNGFAARNLARSFTIHCIKPTPVVQLHQERQATLTYPMCLSSYTLAIRIQQRFFPNFEGQVAIQFDNAALGLMDLSNVEFPPALKTIRKCALPVRKSARSSWTLQLSGIRAVHAIPLYHLLVRIAEMATQDITYMIPLDLDT
ncbi:hypothetical protein DFH05DRAFT_1484812 [Lentinula detonsa]|uniref:Uncharacterized protein n=1 Tax=Lentinula detonsa TaxID=2804962 RepID=A0A9W8TZ52_9AGAR|nr:hypothetical protein DFH05DRAFT_1484812 [Lentinula detonsa]